MPAGTEQLLGDQPAEIVSRGSHDGGHATRCGADALRNV